MPPQVAMVKVSLPVVITNSERLNKRHELLAGAAMAQHLAGLAGRFGALRFGGVHLERGFFHITR